MTILVRKATPEDAQDIFNIRVDAIRNQCKGFYPDQVLETWTSGSLSDRFRSDVEQRFYVAVVGDYVTGTGMIDLNSGQIDAVFVRTQYVRKGVGRAIVTFLEALARLNGLNRLTLDSTLNAALFYRSIGFEGTLVSKYVTRSGLELACIPMEKHIQPAQAV